MSLKWQMQGQAKSHNVQTIEEMQLSFGRATWKVK